MHRSNFKILQLDQTDSTNEFAKKLILQEDIQSDYVIVAEHQTHGKGRLGRVWESAPSLGLWMSVIVKPEKDIGLAIYNFATAVTVCETLRELTYLPLVLKWPNDVLTDGKKICGMLLETVNKNSELYLVIGIGININQQSFAEPLDKTATSLFIETQTVWDRNDIMQRLFSNLLENYKTMDERIFNRWKSLTLMLNKPIIVEQGSAVYHAWAKDIADDGALVIERNGKIEKLYAGDVRIQLN